ncbi:outer membrane beta-barrel family protein [Sphingosinicella sp. YJ22]|uniref:TonB-dependent receptor n=1 Tax=Sphingosinicella sp. YJ22 TaxID=1104780 RepID=UPI0014092DD2|nr:outer membrane beta-barrel family protein [Sphingosinicella sp. YJ22]
MVRAQSEQRTSIDRETYLVRDNAQARTSNALDILGRIPAVTVQPDNSVSLLGTTGVTVLVDGRPSPNPNVLRDLQGSEIARIEVVTNPSAQFSASGTGGIINIITRRDARGGLRGSATASVGRYGSYEARVAPTWSSGNWTITANLGVTRNGTETEAIRERINLNPASSIPDTLESQEVEGRFRFANANTQITYRLSDKKTVTLSGGLITAEARNDIDSELLITPGPATPISQLTTNRFDYNGNNIALEYRAEGRRPAELLTASIQQFSFSPNSRSASDFNGRIFQSSVDTDARIRNFKIDYVRPLGTGWRLLTGGSLNHGYDFSRTEQSGELPFGGTLPPTIAVIEGSIFETAAYGSLQFPLFGGTVLAGLRGENRDYELIDPVLGTERSEFHLFPSASYERRVAEWLTANLSYSRRIAWPQIPQLSPVRRFQDATSAFVGNPDLRPELTDAFEARLRGEVARQTVSLTLFHRRTDDLFSTFATLTPDGVLLTQPINVGERQDTGVSLAVQGTPLRGWSYNFNANLIDRRIDRDGFGFVGTVESSTYSATAVIDYRDGTDSQRGADRVTLSTTFSGPYDDGLVERAAFFRASASWSHAITDRLTSVLTVDDIFGTEFETITLSNSVLARNRNFSDGPRVKFALTYSFGRRGQQPLPQPQAPAVPPIPFSGQ